MKLMKIVVMTALVSASFFSAVLFADTQVQFAGESMAIGVGARPLGMGGTFAGIADDASTSYWNPAGMTNITGVEVSSVKLTKINDLDTKYSYVNIVYNANQYGSFGVGWLRQAIGGITLTDSAGNIIQQSAENADNVIYLAYAYPITKGFSLGLGGKIMLGNYPALVNSATTASTVSYSGTGLDFGLFLSLGEMVKELKGLQFGLNMQDVFTQITWDAIQGVTTGTTEKVDVNFKPGLAYKIDVGQFEFTPAIDLDTKYQLIVHAGLEAWWNKMIAIRGGIKSWGGIPNGTNNGTLSQAMDWSMGASIRWYFIGIDYAYVYNELTPVQYLSIIGKF
jgi:hypothetical protein